MGVKGLLPLLKSIQKPCSLKQYAGSTLGVDAYGWLHRGTIACAIELAQGKPTTKFVDFAMHRVRMLIHFGIKPFLIFDGDYLPSKKETEKGRAEKRRNAKAAGLELLRMGRTAQAHQELQKGIDVTPEMAKQLMDELDRAKIDFIVAPYEADSQLVYLEKIGVINGIISEDSDMLVFGAKLLLTKLDQFGECVSISRKDFTACKDISLVGWSDDEFRWMCILSGCDYLAPIGSVGLKTAHRLLRKHKTVERVVRAVQFDGKAKIPPGYMEDFRRADLTFQHQWVFCPRAKHLVHICSLKGDLTPAQLPFIGREVEAVTAQKVARGELNPHTKETLIATPLPSARQGKILERSILASQTPDLKKRHSIESFFRAKRTPLAELDPNVFTPSPSQQRLLEQQQEESGSAEVSVRAPVLVRATTEVTSSQNARRAWSDMRPPTGRTSPKRQRLCSDSALAFAMTGSAKATQAHSRFFGSTSNVQSPSVLKAGRKAAEKQAEVNIWSDDSIEEAMSQLEDVAECSVKSMKKKLAVFRDDAPRDTEVPTKQESQSDTQTSAASVEEATWSQDIKDGLDEPATQDALEVPLPESQSEEPAVEDPADINDADWKAAAMAPLNPLPVALEFKAYMSTMHHGGSEDLLVPNSDSEEEVLLEPRKASFGLDLGKFAFAG